MVMTVTGDDINRNSIDSDFDFKKIILMLY